ncbi:MAG: SBBP repeat-containing protein, partial [Acidobacteriota bacterium]
AADGKASEAKPGPAAGGRAGEEAAGRWAVRIEFAGADPSVRPIGEERTPAVVSYFKGGPEDWRPDVGTWARIVYRNLWPGIDLAYSGTARLLKHEFIVHPGADPGLIRLALKGAADVALDKDGRLAVRTPLGGFHDEAPVGYQEKDGKRISVPMSFRLENPGESRLGEVPAGDKSDRDTDLSAGLCPETRSYGFEVGAYDPSLPLVIDPATVIYCGFLGGSANDRAAGIAIDSSGNAYVSGWTVSPYDFPVTVGPDLLFNGTTAVADAFVAKVNAAGTDLIYCGYIGGLAEDGAAGIAVDASGCAYVAGWTYSSPSDGFPVAVGPHLTAGANIAVYPDGFVAKVNAAGTALAYCGYVGGAASDRVTGIAVDASANAYIAGYTDSDDFPVTSGPDLTWNGGVDAFVAKVNAAGSALAYSGFIGGSASDYGASIAVDSSGNAYVTGYTASYPSEHFPVTVGPDLTIGGSIDAFVAKVNAAGTGLAYCGYIGGSGDDYGTAIAVAGGGNAYVTGYTDSLSGFPATVGPDLTFGGSIDAFIARVGASGEALDYCGYIGGTGDDYGRAIA